MAADPDLLEFYGTECKHCNEMRPMIERLEKEIGKEFTKIEIWHNEANMKIYEEVDKGRCGGVPFFFNKKTGKFICGPATFEQLKDWAMGN